jgi:putative two-component system response regulator
MEVASINLSEQPGRSSARILLVEDDEQVLEAARVILVRAGYCVVAVRTVQEAMEVFSMVPVDLLVSDVVLPGGSGFDVAARAHLVRPGLPVILMSAFAASDLVLEEAVSNLQGYLRKPFQPRDLVAAVAAVTYQDCEEWSVRRGKSAHSQFAMAAGTVHGLLRLICLRDAYTLSHSRRVRRLAAQLARAMGMPLEFQRDVTLVGWFHDVGNIHVPHAVLTKAGPLSPAEYRVVRSHAEMSAAILRSLRLSPVVVEAVRHHHERYDGVTAGPFAGYPSGLAGEQIPLLARVVSIADAYAAMTTPRVYRQAATPAAALDEVERLAGSQFDPEIAKAFVHMMRAREENRTATCHGKD